MTQSLMKILMQMINQNLKTQKIRTKILLICFQIYNYQINSFVIHQKNIFFNIFLLSFKQNIYKMSKFNFFLITLLFASFSLFSTNDNEPVLLKSASTNPVDIPFEKWQFPNGLKVLIHEDSSSCSCNLSCRFKQRNSRKIWFCSFF